MDNLFNTVEEVLEDIKAGKPFILVDDYDVDNTGDFVVAAEKINLETLKLMESYSKGIINITTDKERFQALGIQALYEQTITAYQTAKVMSVELECHGDKSHKTLKTIQIGRAHV